MVVARPWLTLTSTWALGSALGMGIPFVAVVVLDEIGVGAMNGAGAWIFGLVALASGLLGGVLQSRVLRSHTPRAGLWVFAAMVCWGLAWLGDGAIGFPAGGVVLGALGGGVLMWVLQPAA
jgi:hypothetical protein